MKTIACVLLGALSALSSPLLGAPALSPGEELSAAWLRAQGPEIVVYLDGKEVLRRTDAEHPAGSVGLRVVDTHAAFSDLTVE